MAAAKAHDDRVIMTREGYDKLKAELIALRGDGRAEIAAKLQEARGFGDLSENAEYRGEERENLKTGSSADYQLKKAIVAQRTSTQVLSAFTATAQDLDLKDLRLYLMGTGSRHQKNRISAASPVGITTTRKSTTK